MRKNVILSALLSFVVLIFVCRVGSAKKTKQTGKTEVDELPVQHQLLRHVVDNDGCQLYPPWSNRKDHNFKVTNNNCLHACKIVNDLYMEHHKGHPPLILQGSCKVGLKLVYLQCKCELAPHYARFLRWRTLRHCARKYLRDLVNFSVNDTLLTTRATELDSNAKAPGNREENAVGASLAERESTTVSTVMDVATSSNAKLNMTGPMNATTRRAVIRRKKKKPNKPWKRKG